MDWIHHFPHAITVADRDGIVVAMNKAAQETFAAQGGEKVIGTSLYLYHKPQSIEKIKHMLATGENNVYTISKAGQKKLIIQQPYLVDGEVAGIVEISLKIPAEMPHYDRG
ncbi:MAG: PAS domain-containing protein [Candidatus Cloacimonadaceae bacterium]|jgi:transcriptional regulator with PAS, ATPase and Fis domain